ncbi:SRPBCC domain-containing protein [Pedobacter sp. JY14-1]|uniref:SRPBCC family protein n=1 Tax=Pedobacter sp. JY14-1 TaxID=3034151 RepID=UPI0023E34EDF|nr:SRPBCC domain-containing protein [Pedobacter sp. JY14-1]
MKTSPLIVERTYTVPVEKVWAAITEKDQMRKWYFDLKAFKPESGFQFEFTGGDENVQYLHRCEVLSADAPNRLSHTWTYPEHNDGYSVVTWELMGEGPGTTTVRLTHEGLESFPDNDPNFAVESFTAGWNFILGESLRKFLEEEE